MYQEQKGNKQKSSIREVDRSKYCSMEFLAGEIIIRGSVLISLRRFSPSSRRA